MESSKSLLATNVVYGSVYADLFLNQHLKSLLDESNIPSNKDRLQYFIFTDADTRPHIEAHPNFERLKSLCFTEIILFEWPKQQGQVNRYHHRYAILSQTFQESVRLALERGSYLSAFTADMVMAKGFLNSIFEKLIAGHDSVFVMPIRAAAESIIPHLNAEPSAYTPHELCRLAYTHLHPLWVACHWRATQFTKLPFSLLWNTGTGLMVRSYSITPIAFVPTVEMAKERAIIDIQVPSMCKNPFWATDWADAPVIGVEPLFCFYPTFANHKASTQWVKEWSSCLHQLQKTYLEKKLYYPDKSTVCSPAVDMFGINLESDTVVRELMS